VIIKRGAESDDKLCHFENVCLMFNQVDDECICTDGGICSAKTEDDCSLYEPFIKKVEKITSEEKMRLIRGIVVFLVAFLLTFPICLFIIDVHIISNILKYMISGGIASVSGFFAWIVKEGR
jgi:hypothetical protein